MGRWIVVDIYRDAKRQGISLALWTDPEGDSCFNIYHISRVKIKKELFVNKRRHLVRVCLCFNNWNEITKMIPETLSIIDSVLATHIKHSLKTQYLVDISGHSFYELSCTLYANEGKC